MLLKCLSVMALFLSVQTFAQDLYDVSVLLPKPDLNNSGDLQLYLKANFPISILNQAEPELLPAIQSNEITYRQLRAISFRLDSLSEEFRIVWQPFSTSQPVEELDGAIHTIYPVSKENLKQLALVLHQARQNSVSMDEKSFAQNPIHPELRNGLDSDFYRTLLKSIEPYISFNRMKKIAIFGVRGNDNGWIFAALDRDPKTGAFVKNKIPHTEQDDGTLKTNQNLVNFSPKKSFEIGVFIDDIFGKDSFNEKTQPERVFFENSNHFIEQKSSAQLKQVYLNLFKLNQPSATPKNTDCFTCHSIDSGITVINQARGSVDSTPARIPGNLRMFGYLNGVPSIAQKTIVDSLVSLNHIK